MVSVTDCSIQQGIIRFLSLIVDFNKELQGFRENMKRIWIPKEAKSDFGAPRPKSAPRGSKSITFQ